MKTLTQLMFVALLALAIDGVFDAMKTPTYVGRFPSGAEAPIPKGVDTTQYGQKLADEVGEPVVITRNGRFVKVIKPN